MEPPRNSTGRVASGSDPSPASQMIHYFVIWTNKTNKLTAIVGTGFNSNTTIVAAK